MLGMFAVLAAVMLMLTAVMAIWSPQTPDNVMAAFACFDVAPLVIFGAVMLPIVTGDKRRRARRIRGGFCLTCGYDLGHAAHDVCPECDPALVCPDCEYDLTGNTTGRCPECGTATRPT